MGEWLGPRVIGWGLDIPIPGAKPIGLVLTELASGATILGGIELKMNLQIGEKAHAKGGES
jgi:hypothetical protein